MSLQEDGLQIQLLKQQHALLELQQALNVWVRSVAAEPSHTEDCVPVSLLHGSLLHRFTKPK